MKKYILAILVVYLSAFFTSCGNFLDQDPDRIVSNDQVFNDPKLTQSALANLYDRVSYGQRVGNDIEHFAFVDEAVRHNKDDIRSFDRNWWRTYDYTLVRNINQFLEGVKGSKVYTQEEKNVYLSEARFLRAWYYFCSARALGGMPLVGDEVYTYTPGMDISQYFFPRAAESEVYDYVIAECQDIYQHLSSKTNTNSARVNRWVAKMLEARAALFAGSLAKYNSSHPNLVVEGGVIGIDKTLASKYFTIANTAALDIVKNSPYVLQDKRDDAKGQNFYEAVSIKSNNTEVIWARDFKVPDKIQHFTKDCIPRSHAGESTSYRLSVLLNLVEEYEPINAGTGKGQAFNIGTLDNPVFYPTASAMFDERDPRLAGTVLYPGVQFAGKDCVLQAGQLVKDKNGKWTTKAAPFEEMGRNDENGKLVTSVNGPIKSNDGNVNKTGFSVHKFLDEVAAAATFVGSDIWGVYFRMSEAYLIASESFVELDKPSDALPYINAVRSRAGVKELQSTVTLDQIIHERRVEFAFEDHRYWDMKRWRLAHKVWEPTKKSAERRGLYPYLVVAPGDPNDGKWFFQEVSMDFLYPNNLNFEDRNYYSEIDQDWINKNPKLKKNPYQ